MQVFAVQVQIPSARRVNLTIDNGGVKLIQSGIPQMRTTNSGPALSCIKDSPNQYHLTYAADLLVGEALKMGPNDPAIRSAYGSFLSPVDFAIGSIPSPPTPIPRQTWSISDQTAGVITIHFDTGGNAVAFAGIPSFHNDTTNEYPTGAVLSGTDIVLTYATPVSTGDLITWSVDPGNVVTSGGQQPYPQTLASP